MEENKVYRQCSRCVYDTNDYPKIRFDSQGVCDICHNYDSLQKRTVFKGDLGKEKLELLLKNIKESGAGKKYDCLVGISGGVDSSYIALKAKEWGLKPLLLHVDNGWNSELAVKNIENIVEKLELDLYTEVLKWEEIRDFQLSFMKASVVDIDSPFDNAFMAILYRTAKKFGIKYIISGHNTVTEGWMPENFCHYKLDTLNLKDIHRKFGTVPHKTLPLVGPIGVWWYKKIDRIKIVSPIDYLEYNKQKVKQLLIDELEWRDYGGKHYENIFTKFYQGYILPNKFKVDKRKSHLSTLICSGQITKEEALKELQKSPYIADDIKNDTAFFASKIGLTLDEFQQYMLQENKSHRAYKSYLNLFDFLRKIKRVVLFQS